MYQVGLRQVTALDAGWIYDACQDSEIQRWTLVPRPYLLNHAEDFASGGGIIEAQRWAICDKAFPDRGLGIISIHRIEDKNAEIGYWVAPWARGERVCSRAVAEVITWSRLNTHAESVSAKIAETNIVSQRVVLAAGFLAAESTADLLPDGGGKVPGIVFRRTI